MPFLTVDTKAQTISATVDVLYTVDSRAQPIFEDFVPPPPPPPPAPPGGGVGLRPQPRCPPGFIWFDGCCIPRERLPEARLRRREGLQACYVNLEDDAVARAIAAAIGLGIEEVEYNVTMAMIGLEIDDEDSN